MIKKFRNFFSLGILSLLFLTGCGAELSIVSEVDEKEANIILVLLESRGIQATKVKQSAGPGAGGGASTYTIQVPQSKSIDALAFLNQNGFPRSKGTNLLQLFAKQGLMSTAKEETIRYQAGLAQQITNMILMIDGVIDASVQLSFPVEDSLPGQETEKQSITAAVYVKHQGIVDDPNLHLESKIKRLISGSITGLDINDVTVVSDKSRYTDITATDVNLAMSGGEKGDYVSIWSIIMDRSSAARFRTLFFLLSFLTIIFAIAMGWFLWKLYPFLRKKGGFKELLSPKPLGTAPDVASAPTSQAEANKSMGMPSSMTGAGADFQDLSEPPMPGNEPPGNPDEGGKI